MRDIAEFWTVVFALVLIVGATSTLWECAKHIKVNSHSHQVYVPEVKRF